MPSLQDLRTTINSVKSTQKITSAMKMVAASKLKKSQHQAEAAQPYAKALGNILLRLSEGLVLDYDSPKLLTGTGLDKTHLLIVITADRGLCGGFNSQLIREVQKHIRILRSEDKDIKIITIGRKARDLLKSSCGSLITDSYMELNKTHANATGGLGFGAAHLVTEKVIDLFEDGAFDVCTVFYNAFKSVLTQKPTAMQLIPFKLPNPKEQDDMIGGVAVQPMEPVEAGSGALYEFDPSEEVLLEKLLPKNLAVQVFTALLDSAAGEQAARMTAMDSATRNASDMIKALSLQYNRARQAYITKELGEIISGAEAVK